MSQLKVLIHGNHPNLALFAWRFQLAKSVDVYHVDTQNETEIEIETRVYGSDKFLLKNHFRDIKQLEKVLLAEGEKLDMVIMSASSLQEISSIASKINSVISNNTKIFVESSGFVNIEPFVKMSLEFSQGKVFSIMSEYDMRRSANGAYFQYNGEEKKQKIYIGQTGSGSLKKQKANGTNESYAKNTTSLLTTFHSLFSKLFPKDEIETCNFSPMEFLREQWKMAIPRICFDPLLVLFEEFKPEQLHEQILAKPLISGLVTEIITLTRAMGCKLPNGFENESNLLKRWVSENGNETPALFYHFIHKSAPLDIDMLLLQPILLADDYSIKTPYLEFLYSMMCQFQKLNSEQSELFTRSDKTTELKNELKKLSLLEGTMKAKESEFASKIREAEMSFEAHLNSMQGELKSLQRELQEERSSSQRLTRDLQSSESNVLSLKQELLQMHESSNRHEGNAESPHTPTNAVADETLSQNGKKEELQYTETGTPVLREFEDIALYGIAYKNSPEEVPKPNQQPAIQNEDSPNKRITVSTSGNVPSVDHSLRERELEIRRKELELQERELDLQRKQSQTMLNQKFQQAQAKNFPPNKANSKHSQVRPGPGIPQKHQAKVSGLNGHVSQYTAGPQHHQHQQQLRQTPNGLPGIPGSQRPIHALGVPPSSLEAGLPIAGNVYPQKHFQKTSRKNRRSNMPALRNPSSTMLNDYAMPQTHPGYNIQQQQGQSRYNSLSGNIQGPGLHHSNSSMTRLNVKPTRVASQGHLQSFQQPQPQSQAQTFFPVNDIRKASSSTMLDEGKSLESVIQRPPTFQQLNQPPSSSSTPDSGASSVIVQSSEPTEPTESAVDINDKKLIDSNGTAPDESKKRSKFFFLSKK